MRAAGTGSVGASITRWHSPRARLIAGCTSPRPQGRARGAPALWPGTSQRLALAHTAAVGVGAVVAILHCEDAHSPDGHSQLTVQVLSCFIQLVDTVIQRRTSMLACGEQLAQRFAAQPSAACTEDCASDSLGLVKPPGQGITPPCPPLT